MSTEWTLELPEPWRTAPFRSTFVEPIAEVALPRGRSALLLMTLLKDGTNVLGLTWDRGARLARVSPDTGWALEERFTGRPPGPGEGALLRAWRIGVDALIRGGKDADAEMAQPGWEPTPAVFVMNSTEAMDVAYETYCAREETPISRELFETAVEVLARNEVEEARSG